MIYPTIGITASVDAKDGSYRQKSDYISAVQSAGGLPIILPPVDDWVIPEVAAMIDGVILAGGGDIDPFHFGEEPRHTIRYDHPRRDRFELQLVKAVLARGRPILGICRGMQVLNVALGGTLYQAIADQVNGAMIHWQTAPGWYPTHAVKIEGGSGGDAAGNSLLARLLDREVVRVNSFHHQAVQTVAPQLVISARADDGLIEAIEAPNSHFVLGVQWHPEAMWEKDESAQAIFAGLIEAARQ